MSKECTYKLKKHLLLVHTVILTKTMTNEGELIIYNSVEPTDICSPIFEYK